MPDDPIKPTSTPEHSASVKPKDSAAAIPPTADELSPEEQMARFEEALKAEDWGHQPC